jgi:hypothetical protein
MVITKYWMVMVATVIVDNNAMMGTLSMVA